MSAMNAGRVKARPKKANAEVRKVGYPMDGFGFAGAEVFEVVEGGGEVFGGVGEGGFDGGF